MIQFQLWKFQQNIGLIMLIVQYLSVLLVITYQTEADDELLLFIKTRQKVCLDEMQYKEISHFCKGKHLKDFNVGFLTHLKKI